MNTEIYTPKLEEVKLIAEFDNWYQDLNINDDTNWLNKDEKRSYVLDKKIYTKLTNFKYHKSWNWLMPICKKCNNKVNTSIFQLESLNKNIQSEIYNYDIEKTFIAVIKYIKMYNLTK